jgi:PAS domain-containing protein
MEKIAPELAEFLNAFPRCLTLWELKEDGIYCAYVNKAAEKILCATSDWIGKPVDICYPNVREEDKKKLIKVLQTGKPWIEERYEYELKKHRVMLRFTAFKISGNKCVFITERQGRCKKTNRDGTQCAQSASIGEYCMTHAVASLRNN